MSLYPIDSTRLFEVLEDGELQLYKVDWVDTEKQFISMQISLFSYQKFDSRAVSTNGGSNINLGQQRLIRSNKINFDNFFSIFLWVEVLSITVLALRYAKNLKSYGELRVIFEKLSVDKRFKLCRQYWRKDFPKRYGNILNLRNQIAHNFDLNSILYDSKKIWIDKELEPIIMRDLDSVLRYLADIMRNEDKIIEELRLELLGLSEDDK